MERGRKREREKEKEREGERERERKKKKAVINVRRHGVLMDRPINGRKNLAQGLMQMEPRSATSRANMRIRSMGRACSSQLYHPQPVNM